MHEMVCCGAARRIEHNHLVLAQKIEFVLEQVELREIDASHALKEVNSGCANSGKMER